jgi:hypothetical protein
MRKSASNVYYPAFNREFFASLKKKKKIAELLLKKSKIFLAASLYP